MNLQNPTLSFRRNAAEGPTLPLVSVGGLVERCPMALQSERLARRIALRDLLAIALGAAIGAALIAGPFVSLFLPPGSSGWCGALFAIAASWTALRAFCAGRSRHAE